MALIVRCPACGAKLSLPDKYRGQLARCPKCPAQFRAPRTAAESAQLVALSDQEAAPTAVATPHDGGPARFVVPADLSVGATSVESAAAAPALSTALPGGLPTFVLGGSPQPQLISPPPGGATWSNTSPATPAPNGAATPPADVAPASNGAVPAVAPVTEAAPRFILSTASSPAPANITQGNLPVLSLFSEQESPSESVEPRKASPVTLAAVLSISFVLSFWMLVSPPGSAGEPRGAKQARERLLIYCAEDSPLKEPYRGYLGEALRAHSAGDTNREKDAYRRIFSGLRVEGGLEAVMGPAAASGDGRPRDAKDLAEQLALLLKPE